MDIKFTESAPIHDTFLSTENAVNRLLEEWDKYGYLIVAYDFDHTVYDTDNTGDSHDQLIELLKVCDHLGCYMIVFTCRAKEEYPMVKEYLTSRNIPFDAINENCPFATIQPEPKILYSIFFDDRCGLGQAYEIMVRTIERRLGGIQ